MNNDDTYTYLLADARKALAARHLLSALQSISGLAQLLKASPETDEAESLTDAYRMLLTYMAQGASDPSRADMYARFVCRAYELTDSLERKGALSDRQGYLATMLSRLQNRPDTPSTPAELFVQGAQADVARVFDTLWLCGPLSAADEAAVRDYVTDPSISHEGRSLALSGLTVSAMRFYDRARFSVLLDSLLLPEAPLRARALVGVVFVHLSHPERLSLYPEAQERLRLMASLPGLGEEFEMLQAQLFLSLETKRIERNLREEIMPQMMEEVHRLRLDQSIGLDELRDKLTEADFNPEWTNDGKASKLAAYMQEFTELQQSGADMYMTTFKMLKQRFPFFNEACNWFWPFTLDHPSVPESARRSEALSLLINGAGLCDSDKYSFCFIADLMKTSGQNSGMLNELQEQFRAAGVHPVEAGFRDALRSYVQGFYRFCDLFTHREAFVNPFKLNLNLADYQPLAALVGDESFYVRMGDFAFKNKNYPLARALYEHLPRKALSESACEKLGCCYEQAGQHERAAEAYELAHDLKPTSAWPLRRLGACLRAAGRYDQALQAYDALATLEPESANVALRQAECMIHLERYSDAFKYLYKADYLAPDTGQAVRALAWCSLLTGQYEQAERYYAKVLAARPTRADWLNAGHAAWLQGQVGEAVKRYVRALPGEEPEHFLQADTAMLRKAGLTDSDLALMTDAVLAAR